MTRHAIWFLALGVACSGSTPEKGSGDITGDTGDAGDGGGTGDGGGELPCDATVLETSPYSEQPNVYYRDPLTVMFSEAPEGADFAVVDGAGAELALDVAWDDAGINASITSADFLGSTSYELTIVACQETTLVPFTTSVHGTPLSIENSALIGNTYFLDLSQADFVRPEGLGSLIGLYLNQPLLVMVSDADDASITLLAAQGEVDALSGELQQDMGYSTYDFGLADFTDTPFFSAQAEDMIIEYDGTDIYMPQFDIEGAFAPDGTSMGGIKATFLADTSSLGVLLNLGEEPDAVCEMVAGFGLECETCPDGSELCMTVEAQLDTADVVDGMELVAQ